MKVKISSDSTYVEIEGTDAEKMLFYCIWQYNLWPDFMKPENLKMPPMIKQHFDVVSTVQAGKNLYVSNAAGKFNNSVKDAVEACKAIGLEICYGNL